MSRMLQSHFVCSQIVSSPKVTCAHITHLATWRPSHNSWSLCLPCTTFGREMKEAKGKSGFSKQAAKINLKKRKQAASKEGGSRLCNYACKHAGVGIGSSNHYGAACSADVFVEGSHPGAEGSACERHR
ncbi:hypothetical protein GOP47_0018988 [Adiantum capillus-veneris]|uniref:Uncharacterized protein n=1 Tax=Adiantum capillus-veneris TaxID=13818 RepID=A0A9D4UE87_ADICA|nr:hypothetical protein GOP47_0018988 [Adiantum capillus-veneris]